MVFNDLVIASQHYFPKLKVAYKDQSILMKCISKLLFFNKEFMTTYPTTIGDTIYIPNRHFTKVHPISGSVVLLHELVHFYDQKKWGKSLFLFLYFCPQILVPLALLLFLLSWKIAIPVILLLSAPIPSFFRMYFEKRAYLSSLYTLKKLGDRFKFNPHLEIQNKMFITNFTDHSYYFMWPFGHTIHSDFDKGVKAVQTGSRPFQDPVFDMIDDLVAKM